MPSPIKIALDGKPDILLVSTTRPPVCMTGEEGKLYICVEGVWEREETAARRQEDCAGSEPRPARALWNVLKMSCFVVQVCVFSGVRLLTTQDMADAF